VTEDGSHRRASWLLTHPVAGALVVGAAFGAGVAGVLVLVSVLAGRGSAALVLAAIAVGVVAGPAFGFLFMRDAGPMLEAVAAGHPPTTRQQLSTDWRRQHDRLHSHPWLLFRIPLVATAVGVANSISDAARAGQSGGVFVNVAFGLLGLAVIAVWIAPWWSPHPPWRGT